MKSIAYFDPNAESSLGISGKVTFTEVSKRITKVRVELSGLAPGEHGIHLHESGDLSVGCKGACSHYNPRNTAHGSRTNPESPRHAGDLCNNVLADKFGNVDYTYEDDILTVNPTLGRAVVVHKWPDDLGFGGYSKLTYPEVSRLCKQRGYRVIPRTRSALVDKLNSESKKTGNAGQRIACAVVGRMKC